jgi:hypothetical protein
MAIETDFVFEHRFAAGTAMAADLLGPLRGFIGRHHKRSWKGTGFNLIWRPNFGGQSGPKDFFLELNLTDESLEFTDITGSGIANRGALQKDIALGGLGYLQQISDSFDHTHQHFEPGVWANVPATDNPAEPPTVVRMASIPHGTTINLQGTTLPAPKPIFAASSITPFKIGSPDDGATNLVHFPEETLATASTSRTALNRVATLTQAELSNPNLILSQAIAGQNILSTTVIIVSSVTGPTTKPDAGGGVDNIAFLTGTGAPPAGGPNALAVPVTAIFWIEHIRDADGQEFDQLQYTQRVILSFKGLSWPHVSVGTLR